MLRKLAWLGPLWLILVGFGRAEVSVLTWNVAGNSFTNFALWTTNAPELQAAGRIVGYLQPDVLTFQEIPFSSSFQLTNFVKAFLPGYAVVYNSGTDGFLRSAILSRFPILNSQSHLDGVSLSAFGSASRFTRDLFEAQIAVPGWPWPLHVFTTHLKSGSTTDDLARRGAEALAISNYLAHTFVTQFPQRPFVLTGDFNEDTAKPRNPALNPIPAVVNAATTLRLLSPLNPATGSERTWSIRGSSLAYRFDYVLPSGLLGSNVISSQVFRTDRASGLPATVNRTDNATASDHLPVLVRFADPFPKNFSVTQLGATNGLVTLNWETFPGFTYQVDRSTNLLTWKTAISASAVGTATIQSATAREFFRVVRLP